MKLITTALCAIISGLMMMQAVALMTLPERNAVTYTDYNDHLASEQISAEWEAKAKAEWASEFGDAPPNLSVEAQEYLEKQTVRKQAELNQRKGKENG
jgi:hypothetical protein